jgi:protein SCO1/2
MRVMVEGIKVMNSRRISVAAWLTSLLLSGAAWAGSPATLPVHDGVGGDFTAPSSLGRDVSLSDYRGKVVFVFFGYTSCQDVCPATMAHLHALMKTLGPGSDQTQVLLVSIDPETDTPEHLAEYLARFDDRFVGLSTSRAETDRIAKLFMVDHDASHDMKVPMHHNRAKAFADEGYLYSHSQQIYLLDKQGRTRAYFFTGSPLTEMALAVNSLLEE